jgi:hypothetical protein
MTQKVWTFSTTYEDEISCMAFSSREGAEQAFRAFLCDLWDTDRPMPADNAEAWRLLSEVDRVVGGHAQIDEHDI